MEWNAQMLREWMDWLLGRELPHVISSQGTLGDTARTDIFTRVYWPTPFLYGHLQTLIAMTLRNLAWQAHYERTIVPTPDGGAFGLDWFCCREACERLPESAPVLLVLHSITGHSNLSFVKSLCTAGYAQGWRPVAMVYRGCEGLKLESPRPYSQLDTDDVQTAIAGLRNMYPDAPILLAGYSLGAMLVAKYLAEARYNSAASGIVAAASVSNPFDLGAAWKRQAAAFPFGLDFFFQYMIVLRFVHYVWRHWEQLKRIPGISWPRIVRCRNMMDMDRELSCKALRIKDSDAYYAQSSSFQYIPKIRTPCLFPVALDDAFIKQLPEKECRGNDCTVMAVTKRGGHCAHLQGLNPFGPSYLDDTIVLFFKAVLGFKHSTKEE
ncbi:g2704 [Coccomyxa viridis]|uniref:G2704 protein n=1 Tax=Coccomyxa viridis TaxID=1274662 RepID=A0ABP1FL14_9CHLO